MHPRPDGKETTDVDEINLMRWLEMGREQGAGGKEGYASIFCTFGEKKPIADA